MKISWQSFTDGAGRSGAKALFAAFVLLFVCVPAFAQVTASSSLEGTVMDIKSAVIPGATVTVSNSETGLSRSVQTNESGAYRFDLLPAGTYEIKVNAAGFGDVTNSKVELLVGKTTNLDFTMSPGTKAETVTVTSDAPLLDQQKTDVGQNITPREVADLPLNGRDLGNLAYLAPGAQPVDSYDPTKNRIAVFGINGSSGRNVNVTVNGIDNKDNTVGGPVMQFPLEAIQEFVISTQRFSAANGRSEGAAVNVVTKSGGNHFHGSGFFFERDKKLNANDFFSKESGSEKPPFSRQQFGGSIGGPIKRDKTFFFFALERQREETSFPATAKAVAELTLVKSLGAEPSPVIPTPYRDTRWNARADHRFNENHNVFVSYNYQTNRGLNDQSNETSDLTAGNFTTNKLILANATLNSILSPKVTNAFTVGYQYWNNIIDTDKKVPTFFFPGGITFGTNVNVPQQSYQAKYQFKDDISLVHGNHSFKTGVDYVWEPKLGGFFEFNPTLEIDFIDLPSDILRNKDGLYPQGFSSPGAVGAMTATSGDPYFNLANGAKMLGFYFQDDWKATHRLTLNLGLRWDKDFNLIGADTQARNRTFLALQKIGHPAARSLPADDNKDFSPRVGFAWDMRGNGNHILRGGYGLYFGQVFLNIPLFMIQQANPTIFASAFSISSSGPTDPGADIVPGTGIKLSNWRFGIDPLPTIPPPQTQLLAGNTGRIMDPDYRNPYTQQWNLGYAYQLNRNSVIEVEYVHTIGLHESKTLNINPRIPPTTTRVLDAKFAAAGLPKLGRIDLEASVGRSRYDALNVSYRRRLSNHFSLNTSYRLSKALAYNGNSAAFRNRAVDPNNYFRSTDFGPTPNDERHRVVASGVFELPYGFQVAPIMQLASARPYNATQGIDVYGFGSGVGAAHAIVSISNPDNLTANKGLTATQLRNCIAIGQCFEVGFDALRGKPFFQLDTRVSKNFMLGEDKKLTVLFQMFDLTNRANFGNSFIGNVRDPDFGKPNGFITPSGVIVPHSFSGELGVRFSF